MSCLNNNYYTRWMSVSEQHPASVFRVDCLEDKGNMFCEDEDSSRMRCDGVIRPGVHDDWKGHRVFKTWDYMPSNTPSHPKRFESQAACLRGPHISRSNKLSDNRIVTFSYHSMIFLTLEM